MPCIHSDSAAGGHICTLTAFGGSVTIGAFHPDGEHAQFWTVWELDDGKYDMSVKSIIGKHEFKHRHLGMPWSFIEGYIRNGLKRF